jgi:hypothetical protein
MRLLARVSGVEVAGALDAHDRWANAHARGLADWWFRSAGLEEVVDVLACSYLARSGAGGAGGVRLIERGMPMLAASVVATVAARERRGYEAAARRAMELLAVYRDDLERAEAGEWGVLLLHPPGHAAGAERALAREQEVSPEYAIYQRALNYHLHALSDAAGSRTPSWWATGRSWMCSTSCGSCCETGSA